MKRLRAETPAGQATPVFRGRLFDVVRVPVTLPDGRRTRREVVHHPGAAAIVPVLPDGRLCLIRQFRFSLNRFCLEIPAGTRERGEAPLRCARRELEEETGYRARRFRLLSTFHPTPGFCTERIWIYLATGLVPGQAGGDEDERIERVPMRLSAALRAVRTGRIHDGKSIIGLLLAGREGVR